MNELEEVRKWLRLGYETYGPGGVRAIASAMGLPTGKFDITSPGNGVDATTTKESIQLAAGAGSTMSSVPIGSDHSAALPNQWRRAQRDLRAEVRAGAPTTTAVIRMCSTAASKAIWRTANRRRIIRLRSVSMTTMASWWTRAIRTPGAEEHRTAIRRRSRSSMDSWTQADRCKPAFRHFLSRDDMRRTKRFAGIGSSTKHGYPPYGVGPFRAPLPPR